MPRDTRPSFSLEEHELRNIRKWDTEEVLSDEFTEVFEACRRGIEPEQPQIKGGRSGELH